MHPLKFISLLLLVHLHSAVAGPEDDCIPKLKIPTAGRRVRTLNVTSNWTEVKTLNTRDGRTLIAYNDGNSSIRVDDLRKRKTIWNIKFFNVTPVINLREGKDGQPILEMSRLIPAFWPPGHYEIDSEQFHLDSYDKSIHGISLGTIHGKLTSHITNRNGDEFYLVSNPLEEGSVLVPVGGEPVGFSNELIHADRFIVSAEGTTLFPSYRSGTLIINEYKNGKVAEVWRTNAISLATLFVSSRGETYIAYRYGNGLMIRRPFAPATPPALIPSHSFEVAWHETSDGEILLATEGKQDLTYYLDVYNLSRLNKRILHAPVALRQFRLGVGFISVGGMDYLVHAINGIAPVYLVGATECLQVSKFNVEVGHGNLKFIDSPLGSYLLTSAVVDNKMIMYDLLGTLFKR